MFTCPDSVSATALDVQASVLFSGMLEIEYIWAIMAPLFGAVPPNWFHASNVGGDGAIMKLQIIACLLCLMVLVSSLDTLPDPPAIQPQAVQSILLSQICHVAVAAKNLELDWLAWASQFPSSLSALDQISESGKPGYEFTLVRQATDTSPPHLS